MNKLYHKLNSNLSVQAFLLTASKILTLLISLITGMLLSRFRSLEEYGTYAELMTVITLAVSIFVLGLPNCINYFLPKAKGQKEQDNFLSTYYFAVTAISLLVGVLLVLLIPFLVRYYGNEQIRWYPYVLFIIPWTKVIIGGRSNMLVAVSRAHREIVHNILNSLALLAIILLTKFVDGTFQFYLILYVMVEVLFTAAVYFETGRIVQKINWSIDFKLLKTMFIFSIPMGLSTAMGTLSTELDKLTIGWLLNEEAVAVYANAGRELPITYLSTSFTAIILPQIVKSIAAGRTNHAVQLWKDSMELCFIIMGFFSAACIVFAPQIMSLLYSDKYLGGVAVFRIYAATLLLRITYWGMILNAYGKSKATMCASLISLAINIVLNFLCYSMFGFCGPAMATFISIFASTIFQVLFTKRITNMKLMDMIPFKGILKILAINWIAAILLVLFVDFIKLSTTWTDILTAVGIGCGWFIGYLLLVRKRLLVLIRGINHK